MTAKKSMAASMTSFAQGVMKNISPQGHTKKVAEAAKTMGKTTREINGLLKADASFTAGAKMGAGLLRNPVTGGVANSIRNMNNGVSMGQAIKKAHSTGGKMKNGVYTGGKLSAGKIAGSVATVGVAGRVATGGGLYRDRYGNVNIPGVPFI